MNISRERESREISYSSTVDWIIFEESKGSPGLIQWEKYDDSILSIKYFSDASDRLSYQTCLLPEFSEA